MDTTTALTGMLPFILIICAVLTLLISVVLLKLYRRATLRGMAKAAKNTTSEPLDNNVTELPSVKTSHIATNLQFIEVTDRQSSNKSIIANTPTSSIAHKILANIRQLQKSTAIIYFAGGLAYALVMTITWLIIAGGGLPIGRALMLITLFFWPTIIALIIVVAIGLREVLWIVGSYILVLTLVIIATLLRNPETSLTTLLILWANINLPPSIFFLFFLHNRIRSVGPIVFTFLLCGVTGAVLFVQIVGNDDASLGVIVSIGHYLGLGANTLFILLHLAGFALLAFAGRFLLNKLGEAYRAKIFSDRSIVMDSMWIMFAVIQSIGFAFEGTLWILTAPLAFIAYKLVVSSGYQRIRSNQTDVSKPLELLLLRVFSLGRRSNRFFDKFSKLWRHSGVINMIAGPDLVTAAVEPHEFLEFAGGDLSRRFVVSEQDLSQRINGRDQLPDPDGRFRIHEFFCHDDTWRMTMQTLARNSDAILMDLRSFSSTNQGCLYELKVLLDTIDLRRVVFIVDKTTDHPFLKQSFLTLWQELNPTSPNQAQTAPAITLFNTEHRHRRAIRKMIALLLSHVTLAQSAVATDIHDTQQTHRY